MLEALSAAAFFLPPGGQERELRLRAHHRHKDAGKAHRHGESDQIPVEEDRADDAEHRFQGEDHRRGGRVRPHLPHVLEEQGHSGGHNAQVGHRQADRRVQERLSGEVLEQRSPCPGIQRRKGELEYGEQVDVLPWGHFGHRHDVGSVKESADQGEHVPCVDRQVPVQRDQSHSGDTEQGGQDVVPVRAPPGGCPVEKGDDHAVHRRQKCIFGGCGPVQSKSLDRIGQEQESPYHRPTPQIVPGKARPLLPADRRQQDRARSKADCQQVEHRDHVQGVLHYKEGGSPDNGCREQHGLGQFFHHMRRHGFTSHLELVSPGVV